MRVGDWMQTYTGRRFWPLDPHIEDICIEDIAAALSKLCRFAGHTKIFYSVAEHSVLVSQSVLHKYARCGLLHDAAEAYMCDIVKPLKNGLSNYKYLEEQTMAIIAKKFNLHFPIPEEVLAIDKQILRDEQLQLMNPCKYDWWCTGETPLGIKITGWTPMFAEKIFLKRFNELRKDI